MIKLIKIWYYQVWILPKVARCLRHLEKIEIHMQYIQTLKAKKVEQVKDRNRMLTADGSGFREVLKKILASGGLNHHLNLAQNIGFEVNREISRIDELMVLICQELKLDSPLLYSGRSWEELMAHSVRQRQTYQKLKSEIEFFKN